MEELLLLRLLLTGALPSPKSHSKFKLLGD